MVAKIIIPNLDNLISRYEASESILKLSREFGIDRGVIKRNLIKAGITPRTDSEATLIRMNRLSPIERKAITANANTAARGRKCSIAERVKKANTREMKQIGISPAELLLADMLRARGVVDITLQKAVGVYNIDIAIESSRIAVEIYGGYFHTCKRHARREHERVPYILNAGWHLLIIWVHGIKHPLSERTANYVTAFSQSLSGNESGRREYRMIWGDCEPVTTPCMQLYNHT